MAAIPHPLGRFYRPEDAALATRLTALSCLDVGITTILDACHKTRSPVHSDAALAAFEEAGIRALHMVGKPLDKWPELARGREAAARHLTAGDSLIKIGVFGQPDSIETSWALARDWVCRSSPSTWDLARSWSSCTRRACCAQTTSSIIAPDCPTPTGGCWPRPVRT